MMNEPLHLLKGSIVNRLLIRLPEVHINFRYRCGYYVSISFQPCGEKRAYMIFVDNRGNSSYLVSLTYYRDPPAACADNDLAGIDKGSYSLKLKYSPGFGRWHNTSPSPPGVLCHEPAEFIFDFTGFFFTVERTDGFRWILKGRVVRGHKNLCNESGYRDINTALLQNIAKNLLQNVTDVTLRCRNVQIHTIRGNTGGSQGIP